MLYAKIDNDIVDTFDKVLADHEMTSYFFKLKKRLK